MKHNSLLLVLFVSACFLRGSVARAQPKTSPALRPPAVPLVTCDPYLSVWSFDDRLTDSNTHHWTGKPQTLISLVRIDDKPYRVAGAQPSNVPAMEQKTLQVLPTRTIYTFTGGGVLLTLTFTTPMLPDDLDVLTRPLTYVAWHAASTDSKPHKVAAPTQVRIPSGTDSPAATFA